MSHYNYDTYKKICKVESRGLLKFFWGGQMHSALHLHFVSTHAETKGGFVREGKRRECGTYRISSASGEDDRRWRIREAPGK